MRTFSLSTFCIMLSLVWAGAAAAQSSEEEDLALSYGDNTTVSIATGSSQAVTRAPSSATVITSGDIKAMGATGLEQVLESVPGLHVSMNNVASNPIYSFRGIHTRQNPQVLMLINGIPITNVFSGNRSQLWGGMPLENVARIEVIRGPGSALYGADAFSGVINVITKNAAEINGTEYGARAGSFNTRDAWIQHGGKVGIIDAAFYLGVGNTDGQKGIIPRDALSRMATVNTLNKSVDTRVDLSYQAWRFRTGYQQRELGSGAGLAGSFDPYARTHPSRLYLDLSYEQPDFAQDWDMSGVVGYYDIKDAPGSPPYTLFPAGAIPGFPNGMIGNPGHSEQHTHASVSAVYKGLEEHRIRTGTGFRIEDMYAAQEVKNYDPTYAPLPQGLVDATGNPALVYLLPHKRNLSYLFLQDEWNFAPDWTLTAGVRHDRYSDFGGTTNPRIALVWDASYNVVIKAMHGTAFRAPSFSELYVINNPVAIGNASLKPETITTDELGFSWQPVDSLKTNLNFFQYHMRNIILPVAKVYQNSGGQTGSGFEFEATVEAASNLHLTGNISVQHSKDASTGLDAGLAPHQHIFARADWRFMPRWQVGATLNNVSGRMREPGDTRPLIPDYTTVDLTLQREKLINDWEISAKVMNLFNVDAREPTFKAAGIFSDLPLPGRAFYIQFQHNLQ
jgi:outer membrane receptor for ferrienterochelin and colicins